MIIPSMLDGETYAEAMRGASQDGGIQIGVTLAGKFSPMLALLLCLPFGFHALKPFLSSDQSVEMS